MNNNIFDIENIQCEDFVFSFQNIDAFRKAFRKKFEFIIAYHATNLTSQEVESIKIDGLKISTRNLIEEKAKHKFIEKNHESYNLEIETYIIQYFNENEIHTKNEINFALIKSDLVENYSFLLFGAESMIPLADFLKTKFHKSFRKILVESGLHYIIEVKIPVEKTDDKWIDNIYEYFQESAFAISLVHNCNLSPENILKIEKTERPKDIHNLMSI